MPNKYNKPGLRSTEDQNGGHGVILCDVGPEDQGLPGRVRLRFFFEAFMSIIYNNIFSFLIHSNSLAKRPQASNQPTRDPEFKSR